MNRAPVRVCLAGWLQRQWTRTSWFTWLMAPFSWIAQALVARRPRAGTEPDAFRAPVPVVVIGNLYVGGTGKTPVVIEIANGLRALGLRPGVVSRGYGIEVGAAARVGQGELDPARFGDEPALIAHQTGCPVAVHPVRRLAIEALLKDHPDLDLILSDDGLQHRRLARDVEIVVQDRRGIGNGWMLPAGPLREPADRLSSVDAIITQLDPDQFLASANAANGSDTPLQVAMQLKPSRIRNLVSGESLSVREFLAYAHGMPIAAAAGIGVPARFFAMLRRTGIVPVTELPLRDHAEIDAATFAGVREPILLVTAKDAVKCAALADPRIWVVEASASFSVPDFPQWIARRLNQARRISRLDD